MEKFEQVTLFSCFMIVFAVIVVGVGTHSVRGGPLF